MSDFDTMENIIREQNNLINALNDKIASRNVMMGKMANVLEQCGYKIESYRDQLYSMDPLTENRQIQVIALIPEPTKIVGAVDFENRIGTIMRTLNEYKDMLSREEYYEIYKN